MSRANPENAIIHDDTHHLICHSCGGPLHEPLVKDILLRSISEINELLPQLGSGLDIFRASRGYTGPGGEGSMIEATKLPIHPTWQQAIDESRAGLATYPITGAGVQFRNGQGGHVMKDIYQNQTGQAAMSPRQILEWIKQSGIKGVNSTSYDGYGGLSSPGKMWGGAEDLPTAACNVGGILRHKEGSACSGCYADYSRQNQEHPQRIQWRNMLGLANPMLYAAALSYQIENHQAGDHIRLFSAGDLQSPEHLAMMVDIARAHPEKQFWLPTREYNHVGTWLEANGGVANADIPSNLSLRLSTPKGNELATGLIHDYMSSHPQISVSTMNASHLAPDSVWVCPAAGHKDELGKCETHGCNACWDPNIEHIDYSGHSSRQAMMDRNPLEQQGHDQAVQNTQMRLAERQQAQVPLEGVDLSAFNLEGLN